MIYGVLWTAFIIMCIIAVVTSIDTLSLKLMPYVHKRKLYKIRWTDKKPKLLALSWRCPFQRAADLCTDWEQSTEWPNLAWGDLTLDLYICGKYGFIMKVVTGYTKNVWQED